ncbi:hypothetical protein [Aureibacter tunicatorum]|uniref:Uncharacterized protein n=1 Tax=Aureibacter tunicatorum TaxID=866807 RepID=A0AAE4BS20_9BACT|nr:hypothetical protein [Aureibacter tunicatorum]MDR6237882.1 hypothetical protein [Aureibacter tunicatorum]BDD02917.1 hypothetical protein AUTU_04000 [Aureibacter tunicatorum]
MFEYFKKDNKPRNIVNERGASISRQPPASSLPVQMMLNPKFTSVSVAKPKRGKTAQTFFLTDARGHKFVMKFDNGHPSNAPRESFASNFIENIGRGNLTAPESKVLHKRSREIVDLKKILATDYTPEGRELYLLLFSFSNPYIILQEFSEGSMLEYSKKPQSPYREFEQDSRRGIQMGRLAAYDLFLGNWDRLWYSFNEGNMLVSGSSYNISTIDQTLSFGDMDHLANKVLGLGKEEDMLGSRMTPEGERESIFTMTDVDEQELTCKANQIAEKCLRAFKKIIEEFMSPGTEAPSALEGLHFTIYSSIVIDPLALTIGFVEGCFDIAMHSRLSSALMDQANHEQFLAEASAFHMMWQKFPPVLDSFPHIEIKRKLDEYKAALGLTASYSDK